MSAVPVLTPHRHPFVLAGVSAVLLAATPAAAESGDSSLRARYDKGVVVERADGAFSMRLALRLQLRAEAERSTAEGSEVVGRGTIPRARLQLTGQAFRGPKYKIEVSLGDRSGFSFIRDAWLESALAGSKVRLRFGQWRRPFDRHEMVTPFLALHPERAITARFGGGGRDFGLALHNDYESSPKGLEWVVGVFNRASGDGDRPVVATECESTPDGIDCTTPSPTITPRDAEPGLVARAAWNHGGIKAYSEGDLEGGPLRFAVGASYKVNLAALRNADPDDGPNHALGVDAMLKVAGWNADVTGTALVAAGEKTRLGALVQFGRFVAPKRVHVSVRAAVIERDDGRQSREVRVGTNWMFSGYTWRWSNDVGVLDTTGRDPDTMELARPTVQVRSMLQMLF